MLKWKKVISEWFFGVEDIEKENKYIKVKYIWVVGVLYKRVLSMM